MQIGYLGDILFQISSEEIKTIRNMRWSGSARYAEHQRHLNNALTEATGLDPDKISFQIQLSADLGVDVRQELVKLWTYKRQFTTLRLVIGPHAYGKFRWTIPDFNIDVEHFDRDGNMSLALVAINLLEYVDR
ncbi:MAG: phage tail protein [Oscillospiraceae bacterium]|nr:phage tail protein [Oscillospiraceae bacterium]